MFAVTLATILTRLFSIAHYNAIFHAVTFFFEGGSIDAAKMAGTKPASSTFRPRDRVGHAQSQLKH